MALMLKKVERPRELKWYQAGAMLYGDWGTSKAYTLGIAFALAGHASWLFLGLMSVLMFFVGLAYMIICKVYPDGGGVYSSVKQRSQTLAVFGALLLVADYVVTASLSALDAFHYFNVPNPEIWAVVAILVIGAINWFGPAKGGNLATLIGICASLAVVSLFLFTTPHLAQVHLEWPQGGVGPNWSKFVGIILALSGVEAIANMTGIMVEPVGKTARKAIWVVLIEVSVLTFLLGIAMNAVPNLGGRHTEDMLRALGNYFVAPWFGHAISLIFGMLLLSAVNTAITGLVSIQFALAKDRELPHRLASLNRYGMPWLALIVATAVPALVLVVEHDIVRLAALYAIGVAGAITLNVGTCATNFKIRLSRRERLLLASVSLIMLFIELTICVQKQNALFFVLSVLTIGFILRYVAKTLIPLPMPGIVPSASVLTVSEAREIAALYHGTSLVALKGFNQSILDDAALRAKALGENAVYLSYVEEVPPLVELPDELEPSRESLELLAKAEQEIEKQGLTVVPVWQVGTNPGKMIAHAARELGITTVMIGTTKRSALVSLLRGDVLRSLAAHLPKNCRILING
ncbi:MAG: amino acid permease [Candidatus Omnitrophota bacterium]|jgi:amino acid transporter